MRSDRTFAERPLVALTAARFKQFAREPSAIFWTFGFPILLTIALGIAFRSPRASEMSIAVIDGPRAPEIVRALAKLPHTPVEVIPESQAEARLRQGKAAVAIVPPATRGAAIVYRFDPSRPEAQAAQLQVNDALQRAAGRADAWPVKIEAITAPGSRYIDWLVPGLLGMQLMSGSLWGISFVIVENRQRKLLKRLVATPMRRRDYLLAFLLSRLFFVLIEVPVLVGFAAFAFGVRVQGSVVSVFLVSLLGAAAFAGLGLLCASRAQNTETANGLVNLATLPMFVLSGVFFSASRFPAILQPLIRALPLTALNDALRALINDGRSLAAIPVELAILAAWGLVAFVLALRIFRWS